MTPLLLLAAGGAAVYFYLQSKDGTPPDSSGEPPQPGNAPGSSRSQITVSKPAPPQEVAGPLTLPPGRWGWPVPKWQDRAPVISDGFRKPRANHNGVDVMFARLTSDPFPIGSPNATKGYVMPDSWAAVAASDGYLWSAGRTSRGFAVVIDHGPVATFYTHLAALFVPEVSQPSQRASDAKPIPIKAGQPLGVIGADPLDKEGIKHLHFELWRGFNNPIDPAPLMAGWEVFSAKEVSALMSNMTRNARGKRARDEPDLVHVTDYWRAKPGRGARP
jgi:murein DD-endopeptidase MepM/ murein hydrolase activator NlpD